MSLFGLLKGLLAIRRNLLSPIGNSAHKSKLRREDVEVRGGQVSVNVQVTQSVVLITSLAFELQV